MTSRAEETKSLTWDLDEILTDLKFGRYQLKNLLLIGLLLMFANIFPLSFTLTAGDLDYRCRIPECDNNVTIYKPSWLTNAVPFKEDSPRKCEMYQPVDNVRENLTCSKEGFNTSVIHQCHDWVFATEEVTIVKEFNILCEQSKWELAMIGTINNIGQFFGIPIFGIISDRYGRKFVALSCTMLSVLFGILRGLSTSYLMFAAFEFLDSFFGSAIYGTAFILGIELVNPSMRPIAATIIGTFYPIGAVIMGLLAWYLQNWRQLLIACYSPALLFVLYYWLIPESVRWLQTNGRHDKAFAILKKISDSNDIKLPDRVLEDHNEDMFIKKIDDDEPSEPFWKPIFTAFKSKQLLLRLFNCSFSWFTGTLVYYGLSINSISLAGDKYLNFILTNAVEVPAFILSGFIMEKVERRVSLSAAFFFSGITCILCEFIPADMQVTQIVFFLLSKFLITTSFNIIYIYSAEMFPTELRLSLCGLASMFGRVGSMIAPQTVLLRDMFGKHAPVLLFGVIAVVAGGLSTSFPETLNKKLPDTLNQAKLENEE
ncbi:organic cation transporter protein-like isoform X2 [Planococcus citri]|uniref:organic cation transporter protein-like isoform X2 n=1 Tax=Planococcus citri TaxID=170843 RepID=UPI0031F84C5B